MYVFGNGPNKNTHMYSVPQIVLLRDCLFHELEAVPKPERYNGRYFSLIHPPTHSEKEITPPPASGKRLASELSAVGAQMQHRRPLFLGGCYFSETTHPPTRNNARYFFSFGDGLNGTVSYCIVPYRIVLYRTVLYSIMS